MSTPPFIDIHTHRFISAADILTVRNVFAAQIPGIKGLKEMYFSAGLHPWHIVNLTLENDIFNLEEIAGNPHLLAIGEVGLDRLCEVDFDLQKEAFARQLKIAENVGKPVIIHAVKAFPEIISIYQKYKSKAILIFHGFSGNLQIAEKILKMGFYFSFGRALLNQKSNAYWVFSQIPDACFFLETDDSGYSIEDIYAEAAKLKGISILEMKKILVSNFEKCFKIKL